MRITLKPLAEQVILITGASSGIGLVTARMAAAQGAKVVLVARNEKALAGIVAGLEAEGREAVYAVADIGDPKAVAAAAKVAIDRFGRIDTWVNNAGIAIYAKLVDLPLEEHQRMMRTNYFGSVIGCVEALEHLSKKGGALIQVGSIASDIPSPILGAYAATKHATKAYFDALRMELGVDKVPVSLTLVKPSGIDTPIAQHAANHRPGEALIPPPSYAPELVAEVILDAAVRPRREITVGGVGRAQVLIGQHFPQLLDLLAGIVIKGASDPKQRKTKSDSLFTPARDGNERSGTANPIRFSLYTALARRPGLTGFAAAALTGAALLVANRKRLKDALPAG